jgi:hypothetical protein
MYGGILMTQKDSDPNVRRYKIVVWHSEIGSIGTVIDTHKNRRMGTASTFRDGAAWRQLLEIQRDALNRKA